MSASGVPCLSDLRLSKIIKAEGVHKSTDIVGSLRWISPELIRYDTEPDSASDVWAYGMTVLVSTLTNPWRYTSCSHAQFSYRK